jgi:hypothetical protein
MIQENIKIYATDETARLFLLFQQHYDVFKTLIDSGALNQRNASVTLHFDNDGTLKVIQRADFLYSKKHEKK